MFGRILVKKSFASGREIVFLYSDFKKIIN